MSKEGAGLGDSLAEVKEMRVRTDVCPTQSSSHWYKKRVRPYTGGPDYLLWKDAEQIILTTIKNQSGRATLNELSSAVEGTGKIKDYFREAIGNLVHRGNHHTPILVYMIEKGERVFYFNPELSAVSQSHRRSRVLPQMRGCSV